MLGGIEGAAAVEACAGPQAINIHELVEDDELDGELDGIGERLGASLVDPLATVDLADEGDVERDAKDVEVDQELLGLTGFGWIAGEQHFQRGADVDDGDDEFLEGEDDELDALIHIIHGQEHAGIRSIAAKGEDGGRDLEDAEVDNDHDEDNAQHPVITYNQMQA